MHLLTPHISLACYQKAFSHNYWKTELDTVTSLRAAVAAVLTLAPELLYWPHFNNPWCLFQGELEGGLN